MPIGIRLRASRPYLDVALAVKVGFDIIVLETAEADGRPSAAAPGSGVPAIAALPAARRALDDCRATDRVSLVACGAVRSGADLAAALALGSDCVVVDWGPGMDGYDDAAAGDIDDAAQAVAALVDRLGREAAAIAQQCGKSDVHHLDPADLRATTLAGAALSGLPLTGHEPPAATMEPAFSGVGQHLQAKGEQL